MSITVCRVSYRGAHFPNVKDDRAFFEELFDLFGVDGSDSVFYLPDFTAAWADERLTSKPKKFKKAVLEFGDKNGWDKDYWIGW